MAFNAQLAKRDGNLCGDICVLLVLEVNHGQVFAGGAGDGGNPCGEVSLVEKLAVVGALLVDGKNFVVGQQREVEFVIFQPVPPPEQG